MVHTFKAIDRYFLLDSESGSIFLIDEPAFLAIKNIQREISNDDIPKSKLNEILEASKELLELKEQGILFSENPNSDIQNYTTEYNGIIKSICLNISHRCNLKCRYCFADNGTYGGQACDMSEQTAKKAIDFLITHSGNRHNLEVDFFGGEPMLNFKTVKSTIEYALEQAKNYNKDFRFTITTNGYILNSEDIEFINKYMYNVVISIDGRKETHNYARPDLGGRGSFDRALNFAKKFREIRGEKNYYIRGTYTANNLDFSNDVFAINDSGFDQISIEPVILPDSNSMALLPQHLPVIFNEYECLAREYLSRRKTEKWFNFFHFMIDLEGGPCEKKRVKACGAGTEYVAVSPDGKIYPCHQFVGNSKYVIGDLNNNIFVNDIPLNENIRKKFHNCNIYSKSACSQCWAKYYCSGGCSANNININDDINKPIELMCKIMKKRIECAIAVNIIEKCFNDIVD